MDAADLATSRKPEAAQIVQFTFEVKDPFEMIQGPIQRRYTVYGHMPLMCCCRLQKASTQ